jgi:hypothetical protein
LDKLVKGDLLEVQDNPEDRDLLDSLDNKDKWDLQDNPVNLDHKDQLVHQDNRVPEVLLVLKVPQELQGNGVK